VVLLGLVLTVQWTVEKFLSSICVTVAVVHGLRVNSLAEVLPVGKCSYASFCI